MPTAFGAVDCNFKYYYLYICTKHGLFLPCHVSLTYVHFPLCIVSSIVAVLQAPMAKTMVEIINLGVYSKAHTWRKTFSRIWSLQ